ncbi:MAG: hypothetical protein M3Y18_01650 [Candidatus Eremiobacteraeota bacterium]|nr:hypothetical protein [Candidatus Eremiobacteraeota bacterium]
MRIAFTVNGPGETAGWLRPLLRQLYAKDPQLDAHIFCVPDDYATGREADIAREWFPRASVYEPRAYLRVALGRALPGLPQKVDLVQYLGGDLLHAMRLRARFEASFATYKFSRPKYAPRVLRAFAVDAANAVDLHRADVAQERIAVVGNLAIDGALLEAKQPLEAGSPDDGILFMPGSRRYEVEHLIPFFFTAALRINDECPDLTIGFGIAPFTPMEAVRKAIEAGGHPRIWAQKGHLVESGGRPFLVSLDGTRRYPIVRNALSAAAAARLVVTLPGTKVIELAALGKASIAITPLNAPEEITINGPLTYLNRVPFIGAPLKRAAVVAVARRHRFHTQPNIDAGKMLVCEIHGTLTPGRVARVAIERWNDRTWIERTQAELGGLYAGHVGASERMADGILELRSEER